MNYRGLLSDFDGTVHHRMGRVSLQVQQALSQLCQRAIPFGFSTGRQFDFIAHYARQFGAAHVICGGSCLVDSQGRILRQQLIDADIVRHVVDQIERAGGAIVLKTHLAGYGNGRALEVARTKPGLHLNPLNDLGNWQVAAFYASGLEEGFWDELCTIVPGISLCKQRFQAGPLGVFIDGVAAGVSKTTGVQWWCEYHGLDPQTVIAIGDGENDLPMFAKVGLGLAMGNAVPELKNFADAVIPSIDEDGVAWAIGRYFHA